MLRVDQLSIRQRKILDGVAAGKSNGVIAREIGITLDGVKWHVSELLGEGGFANRQELAEWWRSSASSKAAPGVLPRRAFPHVAAGGVARIAAVFVVAAAIAFGIAAAAYRSARVIVAPTAQAADRLAYIQNGDLWAKTLPHGVPVRITASGKASYPRWSHSGEWLAYGDGSSEWIARADGSDTREVHDFGWWSPVDDRYAGSNSDGAIITRNAAGTDERIVVPAPTSGEGQTARFGGMAWSPDGQWLAYTVEVQGTTGTPPYREASMWVVSADGGTPTKVYDGGSPSRDDVGIVGWSPEGLALFYTLDPSFSADIPADGLPLQALVVLRGERVATGERPRLFAPAPATVLLHDELRAMGPRKTSIVVTEGAGRETWTNKRVSHVSWVDGVVVGLTASDVAAIDPAESPDGERIAYVAAPDAPGVPGGDAAKAAMALRRIWVMDADGSDRRQLTDDPAYRDERPMWSGDGSRIYFVRLDTDDKASVWSVPSGGGEPTELVNDVLPVPAQEGAPAWFGYYGYIAWDDVFALWTPPVSRAP